MTGPSRVLLVTPDYPPPPGGIQTIVRNLERGLDAAGCAVRVLHVDPDGYHRRLPDFLPRPRWCYSLPATATGQFTYLNAVYREAVDAIESFEPDVVHAMHVRNWPALVAARERGLPTVLSTYALELEEGTLAANAIEDADVVHAISEFTASLVREAAPGGDPDVRVIPPSIDVGAYRDAADATDEAAPGPVVTLARFVERKNIETVVDAWGHLASSTTDGRELVVAGDGPLRADLQRRARKYESVRFPGWVNGRDKRELLADADVFAMVPRREEFDVEGFGIVYIEAQAANTPVVGSRHGGAPEAIDDAGIVIDDENDPGEVAGAIETLLTDERRRSRHLSAAEDRIGSFDVPAVTSEHLAVYRDLVV